MLRTKRNVKNKEKTKNTQMKMQASNPTLSRNFCCIYFKHGRHFLHINSISTCYKYMREMEIGNLAYELT